MLIEFQRPTEPVESRREWVLVTREGHQVMAMVGRDLQEGLGGFGATVPIALRDLADRMEAEGYSLPGIDF
jgi:hypothetical protein